MYHKSRYQSDTLVGVIETRNNIYCSCELKVKAMQLFALNEDTRMLGTHLSHQSSSLALEAPWLTRSCTFLKHITSHNCHLMLLLWIKLIPTHPYQMLHTSLHMLIRTETQHIFLSFRAKNARIQHQNEIGWMQTQQQYLLDSKTHSLFAYDNQKN